MQRRAQKCCWYSEAEFITCLWNVLGCWMHSDFIDRLFKHGWTLTEYMYILCFLSAWIPCMLSSISMNIRLKIVIDSFLGGTDETAVVVMLMPWSKLYLSVILQCEATVKVLNYSTIELLVRQIIRGGKIVFYDWMCITCVYKD